MGHYQTLPASQADTTLVPRPIKFHWGDAPLQWIPDDPFGSHIVNHFSFTLVRGELFFCRVFNQALPFITDDALRRDVKTFIRHEAIHSGAHRVSIAEYQARYGVDIAENQQRESAGFAKFRADNSLG